MQQIHQRFVHPGPLVLRTAPLKFPAPTTDRDRTVSRRSEPSSRTALMGEQPNPWDLLDELDVTAVQNPDGKIVIVILNRSDPSLFSYDPTV